MGCDIHLHTEIKIASTWHHYGSPSCRRLYRVFAKMADVRNYEGDEPLASPRGLPEDCSVVTLIDYRGWGDDAHSASWLDADEIVALYNWIDGETDKGALSFFLQGSDFGYLFGDRFDSFRLRPDEQPDEVEDVRFVFWFDC